MQQLTEQNFSAQAGDGCWAGLCWCLPSTDSGRAHLGQVVDKELGAGQLAGIYGHLAGALAAARLQALHAPKEAGELAAARQARLVYQAEEQGLASSQEDILAAPARLRGWVAVN